MPVGNPEVLAAMLAQYPRLLSVQEQAHQQEHWYENSAYKCISNWFDCIEDRGHEKWIHPLMKRVNALGAKLNAEFAFAPEVFDIQELDRACESMLRHLDELHAGFIAICEAAEPANDYVTQDMIWDMQRWLEKQQRKFTTRLEKIRLMGVKMFLQENMD